MTALAYWKFESISLQRRVGCELGFCKGGSAGFLGALASPPVRAEADRMFDPSPHFGIGAVFRPFDLIDDDAVAIAVIDKVLRARRVSTDHRPLATVGLVTPHAGFVAVQRIGQHRAVGDIGSGLCRGRPGAH